MEEVPFEDRHVPRVEIDWDRSMWWWYPLTRAVHPAIRMFSLVVALIAMLLAQAGLWLGQWLFAPQWESLSEASAGAPNYANQLWSMQLWSWLQSLGTSALTIRQLTLNEVGFLTFTAIWLAAVFGLFGGLLARRAAVELGQRTVAAWGESLRVVFSRWSSFLWVTGMHFTALLALLLPVMILGLISRLGTVGATIAGILLLLYFPLVFGIGRLVLSGIVCFPLSVCAISLEKKADAFEGFSRSNAYFFQRPVAAIVCVLALVGVGLLGEQIVFWGLSAGWWLTSQSYLVAGGGIEPASVQYLAAGRWLIDSLIAAYWFSFFWSGAAAVYLVLRKSVDSTELDDIDAVTSAVEETLPEIPRTPPADNAAPSHANQGADAASAESPQAGADNSSVASPESASPESASDDKPQP